MSECFGIILAGGRSSRFGRDKANAVWRGEKLINHAAAALRTVCSEIVAVRAERQRSRDWRVDRVVLDDPSAAEGPLRGIVRGLEAVSAAYAIVLACDCPSAQPGVLRLLRERASPSHLAVVPVWDRRLQPLTALYARAAAPHLERELRRGEASPRNALRRLPFLRVPERDLRRVDPQGLSFSSANTPAELARLEGLAGFSAGARRDVRRLSAGRGEIRL